MFGVSARSTGPKEPAMTTTALTREARIAALTPILNTMIEEIYTWRAGGSATDDPEVRTMTRAAALILTGGEVGEEHEHELSDLEYVTEHINNRLDDCVFAEPGEGAHPADLAEWLLNQYL